MAKIVVLVEGPSDVAAIRALASVTGHDLTGVELVSMGGATNIREHLRRHESHAVAGLCDAGEERFFRRALTDAGLPAENRDDLAALGFFVCEADLEDELLRALGVHAALSVVDSEGELAMFRRFQRQPAQRARTELAQLHRFAGTRSGRKIRLAAAMAGALAPEQVPTPLGGLLDHVVGAPAPQP